MTAKAGEMDAALLERWLSIARYLYLGTAALTVILLVLHVLLSAMVARAKDLQITKFRTEAEERIALSNQMAADANRTAAEANKEVAKANVEVAKANAGAEEAKAQVAKANAEVAKANVSAEEAKAGTATAILGQEALRKQSIELSRQLEKERRMREDLESAIAPRLFDERSVEKLKGFSSVTPIVKCVADVEAISLASDLVLNLAVAGWGKHEDPLQPFPDPPGSPTGPAAIIIDNSIGFFAGVIVERNTEPTTPGDLSSAAAEALLASLQPKIIQARIEAASPRLPPNTVQIKVGFRPVTHLYRPSGVPAPLRKFEEPEKRP